MKTTRLVSLVLVLVLSLAGKAMAASDHDAAVSPPQGWPHTSPMGLFDRAAAQRGLQVYREVCASCHSLDLVAFRTLDGIGFGEAEIKALSAEYEVEADPDDMGDINMRAGLPSDYFPSPYANVEAAKASNNGAAPPDLSLMVKKRGGAENHLYSILTGYRDPTAEEAEGLSDTAYFNPYMAGRVIAMAPPLSDGLVEYTDGTEATVAQMAYDVTTFLAWTAEPTMEERKRVGFQVMIFLLILCGLLFAVYRRVARRVQGH